MDWFGYFTDEGDDFWNLSDEEARKFAIAEMIRMRIIESADDGSDAHRELVPKAYPAYFDTYDRIDELTGWIDSLSNVYCVGRNGQHHYNNQDHSMATSVKLWRNIKTGREQVQCMGREHRKVLPWSK